MERHGERLARSPGPKRPKSLPQQQDGATTRSTAELIALARGLALHRLPPVRAVLRLNKQSKTTAVLCTRCGKIGISF